MVLHQFPDRQAGALQHGTRFVRQHTDLLALIPGCANDPERRAVTGGGQRACIAMGQDSLAISDQRCSMSADFLVHRDVFVEDPLRFLHQAMLDLAHRPPP